ncbi:MAG TPA: aromatic ring-hydroxylating dioxygenase subunit alpha, partial [Cyanophyceae cyanobacterium]
MTVDTKTPDTAQFTSTLPIPETDPTFNWKNCWYPVTFLQDLPKNRPYSFSLYNEPFVLFRGKNGNLTCLIDRCPHRAAKLSDGQIIDGKIECLYHGWQFGSDGKCQHIPQLAADAKIPKNACVESFKVVEHQGIIWMWRGEPEAADEHSIPTLPDLDKSGVVYTDKITDIPYDYSYFIEHSLDLAHLNFVHDGSQGNRNRKNAQPLEMEVIESSIRGIRGRVRDTNPPNQSWISFEFIAPNIARFQVSIEQRGWFIGQVFHLLPLSQGRCRVLSRSYRNFVPWQVKLTPRWLIHMNQNKILEEDFLLVGQQERIEQLGKNLQEVYVPLDTSDLLIIEYR